MDNKKKVKTIYYNSMHKFLMLMGIIMLYVTVTYIVPNELNIPFDSDTVIAFSIAYIPWACCYFNDTFKSNS